MYKELVISIIIVISIFILNNITEKFTNESLDEMTVSFDEIKNELLNNEQEKEYLSSKTDELIENWNKRSNKLAYYIEHDELEKVDTYLYALKANIESDDYEQAVENLYICEYIIEHIGEKEEFLLKNIF